jgi:hypothetical protein
MLRLASGRGREQHEPKPEYGRIPHGLRESASTPAVAAAGRYCYCIVICGRASRQTRAKWAFVREFHC